LENNLEVPQKVICRVTIWSRNSAPSYIPKAIEHRHKFTNTYSDIIHSCQILGKVYQFISRQTKLCIYTMKYPLALKRNKILIHATAQMNLGNIILSGRNHARKATHFMILFLWMSRIGKSIETERQTEAGGCGAEVNVEWLLMVMEAWEKVMKMFWNEIVVIMAQLHKCTENHQISYFKNWIFWYSYCNQWGCRKMSKRKETSTWFFCSEFMMLLQERILGCIEIETKKVL
jgi:hypothetical protein